MCRRRKCIMLLVVVMWFVVMVVMMQFIIMTMMQFIITTIMQLIFMTMTQFMTTATIPQPTPLQCNHFLLQTSSKASEPNSSPMYAVLPLFSLAPHFTETGVPPLLLS